jgi:hypothetical protein
MSGHLFDRAPTYRVQFLDRAGKSFATDEFRAASDDDAVAQVRTRLGGADGFELWRQDKLVYRADAPTATAAARSFPSASRARR